MAQDPSTVAQRWATRLSGATAEITAGVNAVQQAPGIAAARQKDVWVQNVAAARDKWATRVASVTKEQWQTAMLNKGVPRIATGSQAAIPKMQDFLTQFLPYVERGAAQVNQMPRGTVEQGIARAVAQIRHNAAFKRS